MPLWHCASFLSCVTFSLLLSLLFCRMSKPPVRVTYRVEHSSGTIIKIVYKISPIQLAGCELLYYCPYLGCLRHPSNKNGMSRAGLSKHARETCTHMRLEVPKCTTAERWFELDSKSLEDEGPRVGGGADPHAADLSAGFATPRLTGRLTRRLTGENKAPWYHS